MANEIEQTGTDAARAGRVLYGPSGFEPFLTPFDGTAEQLRAVIEPVFASLGLELVQLFFVRGSHKDTVRIFADRPGRAEPRISMAELEKANRLLSDALDVEDQRQRLFPHAYDLEVGSPGVDRPLTKKSHFVHARGERVKVKTRVAYANARSLTGTLVDADDSDLSLRLDGQEDLVRISFDDVQNAHSIFVFEAPKKPGKAGPATKPGKPHKSDKSDKSDKSVQSERLAKSEKDRKHVKYEKRAR